MLFFTNTLEYFSHMTWLKIIRLVEMALSCAAIVGIWVYVGVYDLVFLLNAMLLTLLLAFHCFRLWRVFPSDRRRVKRGAQKLAEKMIRQMAEDIYSQSTNEPIEEEMRSSENFHSLGGGELHVSQRCTDPQLVSSASESTFISTDISSCGSEQKGSPPASLPAAV